MQTPPSSPTTGVKVAVAGTVTAHLRFCVRQLNQTGFQAIEVRDGDPEGLDCDLLVLYGNCRRFHRYRRLLRRRPERRPRVAIWQVDPLPPVEFDRQLEKRALALSSALDRSRLSDQSS